MRIASPIRAEAGRDKLALSLNSCRRMAIQGKIKLRLCISDGKDLLLLLFLCFGIVHHTKQIVR